MNLTRNYRFKRLVSWVLVNMQSIRWHTQGRLLGEAVAEVRRPGMRSLDVGCGGGTYAIEHHLLHGVATTLSDYSPELLEMARAQVHSLGRPLPADFTLCSAEELPFEDGSFDFIQCMEVLEHLQHPEKALAEFQRVARPGARLVISVPHPPEWFYNEGHVVEGYRRAEISALLEAAGWKVKRVDYCILIISRLVFSLFHLVPVSLPLMPLVLLENLIPRALRLYFLPYDIVVTADAPSAK